MKRIQTLFLLISLALGSSTPAQDYEIYVSDAGNFNNPPWQILKYDKNGENPESFISDNLVWPQDILFLEDQDVVLISNLSSAGYISKHDISTGAFIENFADGINGPTRMKIGADGLLYVLQWSSEDNKVLRYQLDGTFVDEFTSAGVSQSIGLDWDTDGNLYVSSWGGKLVQHFDSEGEDLGTFINSNLAGPTNIWFDTNGDLLVVDYSGGAIKRFDSEGNYLGIYISGLSNPEGIAFYPNGNMLLGNGGTKSVKLFDEDGSFLEDFIPTGSGNLLTPNAVVLREAVSVSVPEKKTESGFLTPAENSSFIIHSKLFPEAVGLVVYNLRGEQVLNITLKENKILETTHLPSGLYVAVLRSPHAPLGTQKLIVR